MVSISCKKASELTEKKLHGELSALERFSLWFHGKICPPCTKYDSQSAFLDKSIEKMCNESTKSQELPNTDALKAKIKQTIKN